MKIRVNSIEETQALGHKIGSSLGPGDLVTLDGDLGAGKTALTKSIAESLNICEYITSPTFTIVNEYHGDKTLYHFDVYRIGDPEEMYDIGYEEYIDSDGICIIEWSKIIEDILPENRLEIIIERGSEDKQRDIYLLAHGERYEKLVEGLIL